MKDYSQNGESIVLSNLLTSIGIHNPVCMEIGAGDGYHFSNTRYFKDRGCDVVMIDCDNKGNEEVIKEFIRKDNVLAFFDRWFNLLSYDTDGNDFWILYRILQFHKPDVICFEVNSQLPIGKSWAMPYNPDHEWDGTWYYGMSYLAGVFLCEKFGYRIYDVVGKMNIIAVRIDHKIVPRRYSFDPTYSHPEDERKFEEIL